MKLSYSLITVIINKAKVGHILSDTIINSCTNIYSVKARGSLIREEWYQKLLPNMHPELEILQLITPHKNTSFVMDSIIQKGEFKRYGSGAIFCQTCDDIYFSSDVQDPQIALNESPSNLSLKKDLVGIFCIVQKDKADPIVRHIIEQGE